MVANLDFNDLPVDFHLAMATDNVIIFVEGTFLVAIIKKVNVDSLARAGREIIN